MQSTWKFKHKFGVTSIQIACNVVPHNRKKGEADGDWLGEMLDIKMSQKNFGGYFGSRGMTSWMFSKSVYWLTGCMKCLRTRMLHAVPMWAMSRRPRNVFTNTGFGTSLVPIPEHFPTELCSYVTSCSATTQIVPAPITRTHRVDALPSGTRG